MYNLDTDFKSKPNGDRYVGKFLVSGLRLNLN